MTVLTSSKPSSHSYKSFWRFLTMAYPIEGAQEQHSVSITNDEVDLSGQEKTTTTTFKISSRRNQNHTKQQTKWHRSRRKPSPTFDNNNLSNYHNHKELFCNYEEDYGKENENNNCDTIDLHEKNQQLYKDKICIKKQNIFERTIKKNQHNYLLNNNNIHPMITTIIIIINVFNIILSNYNVNFANCLVININTSQLTKSSQQQQFINSATINKPHKLFKRSTSIIDNNKELNNETTNRLPGSDAITNSINPIFLLNSNNKRQDNSLTSSKIYGNQRQQQQQQQQQTRSLPLKDGDSVKLAKLQSDLDAFTYLQRYGYMNETISNANLISEDSFQEAIMSFQRFAGIPETGSIDTMTVKYMQMPRCGNKDQSGKGENGRKRKRRKRYALQGSKWRRQELTYRISQYPTRFLYKKSDVDGQIEKAFKIWSQVAPINFVVKKEGRVHIDIRFASGEHGDGDPFDGPGNTLAHAYFPQYGGDAHFDDQEYWTVDSYAGTNIFQVAAHELGHSLGLGHSSVREALMAPFYQKYKPNFKLHADDVLAIQALYGEKTSSSGDDESNDSPSSTTSTTSTTTTTTTEGSVESVPSSRRRPTSDDDDDDAGGGFFSFGGRGNSKPVDLCQDSKIDAITRTEDGNTYVFRGKHYWQIKNEGLASGYPAKISRDWEGLPSNLDAALTWSDGKTFFFKGDKYWRFFNKRREPGYPKLISAGFAGIPNNVDAAFVWSGNGKTYFFKRDKYWRFDSKQEPPVSSQYPKSIKNWSGLPTSGIDGAFKWDNGMTYFFKDDLYYRFDDREFEVDSVARPTFPRQTAEWWFGCTNSNLPFKQKPSTSLFSSSADDNNISNDNDNLDQASSSPPATNSHLLFHRKPQLTYDKNNQNEEDDNQHASTRTRPAGNSISRSILSGLSALFPSTLTSSSSSSSSSQRDSPSNQDTVNSISNSNSNNNSKEDWSFHKGLGEEVRKAMKSSRSVPSNENNSHRSTPTTSTLIWPSRSSSSRANNNFSNNSQPDTSKWLFPISSSFGNSQTSSSNREQSLSELRMLPHSAVNETGSEASNETPSLR